MSAAPYTVVTDSGQLVQAGWREYVHAHPQGNFFQLPEAFHLFENTPGYTPMVFGLIQNSTGKVAGILVSVIQRENTFYGRFTARSIVWGGPLVDDSMQAELLLKSYNDATAGKAIYSQFRNTFDCTALKSAFENAGFSYLEHLNFLVNTTSENSDQLLSAMSKSKARQIKKGLSSAHIVEATTPEEANSFYALLKDLYHEKVNKPLPPKSFFDYFYNEIVRKGLGKYLLIKHEGKIIGGILCPLMPGKAIYEWYIAGLDKEYKEQYPSILATWAAIDYGCRNGMQHFDFLGAGKPDADYGVRDFKSKFGGTLVNFGRFEKIYQPLLMKTGTLGLKLYKYIRR